MTPLLQVNSISFSYPGEKLLFRDLSFSLEKGSSLTILGPNGAGKTSMLNCIAGLLHPSSGSIKIAGQDIRKLPAAERARLIGYVPQLHQAVYGYSVRDFIVMGRAPYIALFRMPSEKDYAIADQIIADMGLADIAERPYTQLSGGQQQQVLIARVLAQTPQLIIMDEPTNHLDYGHQLKALKMIKKLTEEGYSVIFTTHTPDHALLMGGTTAILHMGGKLTVGPAGQIVSEDTLYGLYGVPLFLDYARKARRTACVAPPI